MNIVTLTTYPTEQDWLEVKRRAIVTAGFTSIKTPPTLQWKQSILRARHSPIRWLRFSFYMEIPYWVSVHLCRHVHAQPYVQSQRNDRQSKYDRNTAPQNETVKMIFDVNAEELMIIANKRLCQCASEETIRVVSKMCDEVKKVCPEFKNNLLLVPQCVHDGGICHEMDSCGMFER